MFKFLSLMLMISFASQAVADNYIVAISDAVARRHLGIYGYPRQTTPHLSQEQKELLIFSNVYAPVAQNALEFALSSKSQYQQIVAPHTIFTALQETKVEVHLLAEHETALTHLLKLSGGKSSVSRLGKLDTELIPHITALFKQPQQQVRVIFIYLDRMHKQQFKNKILDKNFFGRLAKVADATSINTIDNHNLALDSRVDRLLEVSKRYAEGFVWFAAHGRQGLGQQMHGKVNVPLLMWFSSAYQKKYAKRYQRLHNNRTKIFSTDLLFDTWLGIFNASNSRMYRPQFDLSASSYSIEIDNALVLDGKQKYVTADNKRWWQSHNVRKLLATDEDRRIIPHWVNSIGKLRELWHDGWRAFEIDLFYRRDRDCFIVGHDAKYMSTMCFNTFLTHVPATEVKKIWLDIKNLTNKNINQQLARLEKIIAQFKFKKEIFIFESSLTSHTYRRVAQAGYHTSYYLPTAELLALQEENNADKLQQRAKSLATQANRQEVAALSFDVRLYPFVKNYLEHLLPSNYVFHVWSLPGTLQNKLFFQNARSKMYYYDRRIKTILAEYESIFHL